MKDRTKEKEELYRKVLGKDAPKRNLTAADLEILKNDPFDGVDMDQQLKKLKENSDKIKEQTQQMYNLNKILAHILRFNVEFDIIEKPT